MQLPTLSAEDTHLLGTPTGTAADADAPAHSAAAARADLLLLVIYWAVAQRA